MPRIRTIKPQFWFDEGLGSICREARLLYIGLWNLSDDQGVFEWRPQQIKAQLFPYDADISAGDIDKWLEQLRIIGNIQPFEAETHPYGYIPTFLKHQEIKKPSQWRFIHGDLNQFITEIPTTNSTPLVTHQYPTSNPPVNQYYPSTTVREKEKEKEKEKIEGKSIEGAPLKKTCGEFSNVLLTDAEYEKLRAKFNSSCEDKINELSEALKSRKGYSGKYTDHYATILSWDRLEKKNSPGKEKGIEYTGPELVKFPTVGECPDCHAKLTYTVMGGLCPFCFKTGKKVVIPANDTS